MRVVTRVRGGLPSASAATLPATPAGSALARADRSALTALAVLFSAGYLAPYLLPTLVGCLGQDFGLTATQSGATGSALLLASACTGLLLAARVGAGSRVRQARTGLALLIGGYALVASASGTGTGGRGLMVAGCLIGGVGSGTAVAVAGACVAGRRDPHRASVLGLLTTSAVSAALYLGLPHLGGGHALAFACLAGWGLAAFALAPRLDAASASASAPAPESVPGEPATLSLSPLPESAPIRQHGQHGQRAHAGQHDYAGRAARSGGARLPLLGSGIALAVCMFGWSLSQNALWGVSGRIGTGRAGLGAAAVGAVFAVALAAGLLGTIGAAALGSRLGRALPIGGGTVLIAVCVLLAAAGRGALPFTLGEIAWNAVYPAVLSYLIGLAASLDSRGRWTVLASSASSLGTAGGPILGTLLAVHAGYPAMGAVLAVALLAIAVPLTAVALRASRGVPAGAASVAVAEAVAVPQGRELVVPAAAVQAGEAGQELPEGPVLPVVPVDETAESLLPCPREEFAPAV